MPQRGDTTKVKELIKNSVDVNAKDNKIMGG